MKKATFVAILTALVVPAMAAPTYWDLSGIVSDMGLGMPPGVQAGQDFTGRIWGDPVTNELWEITWQAGDFGFQLDFLELEDNDYHIYDWHTKPEGLEYLVLDIKVLGPGTEELIDMRPGTSDVYFIYSLWGDPYHYPEWAFYVDPVTLTVTSAPHPDMTVIPAPGAIMLAGLGTSVVGWLRRRRML